MESFYLEIRAVHMAAVALSGLLMLLRGVAHNGFGASWAMAFPLRMLTYAVDTVLLTAALMLATIVQQYPFADSWLTMKLALLVGYVVLGYLALRGRTPRGRWISLASAALAYGAIIAVARAHEPLGGLA